MRSRLTLLLLLLAACDGDDKGGGSSDTAGLDLEDADPTATILHPTGGTVAEGEIELAGVVADSEDAADALSAWWLLDGEEVCAPAAPAEDGESGCTMTLSAGEHRLGLAVQDSQGQVGNAEVVVEVEAPNQAPTCRIDDPTDGSELVPGTHTLAATVGDDRDPPGSLQVSWSSSLDGELGDATAEDSGFAFLDSSLSAGEHVLRLRVEDTEGEACTDEITVQVGAPPDLGIVSPEGDELYDEGDAIWFMAVLTDDLDPPEAVSLSWESSIDGVFSTEGAGSTGLVSFETDALSPGAHLVTVTATDGDGLSTSASVAFTINGLPATPTIALEPAGPDTTDDLVVVLTAPSTDPEGDAISYRYAWTVDGLPSSASTSDTLPASATTRGQAWTVTVTPNDGRADGASATASVTILDALPEITSLALDPTSPLTDDVLSAVVSAEDADGDSVSLSYSWQVDGVAVPVTTSTLSGSSWFSKGEVVQVQVTPSDSSGSGSPASASVTIGNTAPGAPTAVISPESPRTGTDELLCAVETASTDADGDAITYTATWTVDGLDYPDGILDTGIALSGPETTTWTDDTVPAEDAVLGETWTCTLTPNDGDEDGATASASATMGATCDDADGVIALAGPAELYGFCWYLGAGGEACDDICATMGGSNLAESAASAFSDSCSSPSAGDVSTWFYNNGNPAAWSYGAATGYHTLGYGYEGGSYYGKCYAGTSLTHGTFPGDPNNYSTRNVVCPCFTAP